MLNELRGLAMEVYHTACQDRGVLTVLASIPQHKYQRVLAALVPLAL
jgi:hypothetical protein